MADLSSTPARKKLPTLAPLKESPKSPSVQIDAPPPSKEIDSLPKPLPKRPISSSAASKLDLPGPRYDAQQHESLSPPPPSASAHSRTVSEQSADLLSLARAARKKAAAAEKIALKKQNADEEEDDDPLASVEKALAEMESLNAEGEAASKAKKPAKKKQDEPPPAPPPVEDEAPAPAEAVEEKPKRRRVKKPVVAAAVAVEEDEQPPSSAAVKQEHDGKMSESELSDGKNSQQPQPQPQHEAPEVKPKKRAIKKRIKESESAAASAAVSEEEQPPHPLQDEQAPPSPPASAASAQQPQKRAGWRRFGGNPSESEPESSSNNKKKGSGGSAAVTADYWNNLFAGRTTADGRSIRNAKEEFEGHVLSIHLHGSSDLEPDLRVLHPMVRISIVDSSTGSLWKKSDVSRNVVSQYEHSTQPGSKASNPLDVVMPVLSQPFDLRQQKALDCHWNEEIVFNAPYLDFLKNEPRAVIFFELLDIVHVHRIIGSGMTGGLLSLCCGAGNGIDGVGAAGGGDGTGYSINNNNNNNAQNMEGVDKDGMARIAWGFVKLVGSNGRANTEKPVKVMMYRYPTGGISFKRLMRFVTCQGPLFGPSAFTDPQKSFRYPSVFDYYADSECRDLYPSTLEVTIKSKPQEGGGRRVVVHGRAQNAIEVEEGRATYEELRERAARSAAAREAFSGFHSEVAKQGLFIDKVRRKGEKCFVPDTVFGHLEAGARGCSNVRFSADGKAIAVACREPLMNHVRIFSSIDALLLCTFSAHLSVIYELGFSGDSLRLVTCSSDTTAKIWDLEEVLGDSASGSSSGSVKCVATLHHAAYVYCAAFHPTATGPRLVVTGSYDRTLRLWDADSGELLRSFDAHHRAPINCLCFDRDGTRLYSGDSAGVVRVWAARSADVFMCLKSIQERDLTNVAITCIRVHPLGRQILVQSRDNLIRVMDTTASDVRVDKKLSGSSCANQLIKCCYSPDGNLAIAGSEDGRLALWDLNSGEPIPLPPILQPALNGWQGFVFDVAWSPSEHMIALAFIDSSGSSGSNNSNSSQQQQQSQQQQPQHAGQAEGVRLFYYQRSEADNHHDDDDYDPLAQNTFDFAASGGLRSHFAFPPTPASGYAAFSSPYISAAAGGVSSSTNLLFPHMNSSSNNQLAVPPSSSSSTRHSMDRSAPTPRMHSQSPIRSSARSASPLDHHGQHHHHQQHHRPGEQSPMRSAMRHASPTPRRDSSSMHGHHGAGVSFAVGGSPATPVSASGALVSGSNSADISRAPSIIERRERPTISVAMPAPGTPSMPSSASSSSSSSALLPPPPAQPLPPIDDRMKKLEDMLANLRSSINKKPSPSPSVSGSMAAEQQFASSLSSSSSSSSSGSGSGSASVLAAAAAVGSSVSKSVTGLPPRPPPGKEESSDRLGSSLPTASRRSRRRHGGSGSDISDE